MVKEPPVNRKVSLTVGLIVALFLFLAFYLFARSVFLFYASSYRVMEKILAVFFLTAEAFVMFHAVGYFLAVSRISRKPREKIIPAALRDYPAVAVLVPARHEPKEVLEDTMVCINSLGYPNKQLYLLDDSSDEKYQREAEEITAKYGFRLFRRKQRHGAKAGIINDCLKVLSEKYVAIFDADQNPMPGFLSSVISIIESNPRLAFVQTPQFYSNAQDNNLTFAADMQQAVFYEYICDGKSSDEAMICCGTNMVIRREALLEVGGFDESSVTEDFATSFKLHLKKWRSVYYNHIGVFGMGPQDLGAYFKQQNRWAMGNVGVLRMILVRLLRSPMALSPLQWFEYLVTGSYYFIGWAYLFLIICPVMYIFFNIPSFFMNPAVYILSFVPYFMLSVMLFYSAMFDRHYTFKQLLKGQLLTFITMPVYIRASLLGFFGVKRGFEVTTKLGRRSLPYVRLWPQLSLWAISLAAFTWGFNRLIYEPTVALLVNLTWVGYHFIFLSGVFYFNEER